MKVKVTKKEIRENYKNVISVGYCELQYLLRGKNPNFYTSGIYGWGLIFTKLIIIHVLLQVIVHLEILKLKEIQFKNTRKKQ